MSNDAQPRREHQWYEPREVRSSLEDVLVCAWTATPTGVHRLVPDGCCDLLWFRRSTDAQRAAGTGEVWLCGPETEAWTFELPPGTEAVGIRFRPGLAGVLFDLDVSTILNRRLALAELVGREHATRIVAALDAARTDDDRIEVLEDLATDRDAQLTDTGDRDFVRALLNELAGDRVSVEALASRLDVSVRQLHRRTTRLVGYGTSTLSRIVRFQRFLSLAELETCRPNRSLATLAWAAGYVDQAHLHRDCRALTSMTPTAFLAQYFPTFPDVADPYKTAAPLASMIGR